MGKQIAQSIGRSTPSPVSLKSRAATASPPTKQIQSTPTHCDINDDTPYMLDTLPSSPSPSLPPVLSSSPSRFHASVSLVASVARPVSEAAVQVIHTWFGVLSNGFHQAKRLRNEWKETLKARQQVHKLRERYANEKQQAKLRERAAMERLRQLEQQLANMQQQLIEQQHVNSQIGSSSPSKSFDDNVVNVANINVPPSPPPSSSPIRIASVPQAPPMAPPMTSTFVAPSSINVPQAPPMTINNANSNTVAPAAASTVAVKPASKPDASTLLLAASNLRSINHSSAPTTTTTTASSTAPSSTSNSSSGINLHMLKSVKLKQVPSQRSRTSLVPSSNAAFLFDALKARFHRSGHPLLTTRLTATRTSFGGANGFALQTPSRLQTRQTSAFSPMTPHAEEEWTPAR